MALVHSVPVCVLVPSACTVVVYRYTEPATTRAQGYE